MAAVVSAALGSGVAASDQTITEFSIPTLGSGPAAITVGPEGNLWFLEIDGNKLGRITVAGEINEFAVRGQLCCGNATITTNPADGSLWFTEPGGRSIARASTSGLVTEFPVPNSMSVSGITSGPDGNLWFTACCDVVGRITPFGVFTMFPTPPTPNQSAGSGGITSGPDGNLWFTQKTPSRICRMTPAGDVACFATPTANSLPVAIVSGPDGNLWFTEQGANQIGRITPLGVITEFGIQTAASSPAAITNGPDGALWFSEPGGNRIGRITVSGNITEFPLPEPGGNPQGLVSGPDGAIWFTESGRNKIGRLAVSGVLSLPAAASIHGAAGTFFRTNVWMTNHSFTQTAAVSARYFCFTGQACYGLERVLDLAPRESRQIDDIVGSLFSSPESAGPIQLLFEPSGGTVTAYARVYTQATPGRTFGASILAAPISEARTRSLFSGIAASAGDPSTGFRSNFGVFNPTSSDVTVVMELSDATGKHLGVDWIVVGPYSARQINDVVSHFPAGNITTTDAVLSVTSTTAVFPYVTVIDNQTGDFVYVPGTIDEARPQ
jgi:virginiamycin B lyase